MRYATLALATLFAATATASFAQNPWAGLKGKVKEGQWEYKMQMEMSEPPPGMPPGFKMPEQTFQQCLTAKDIEGGGVGQKEGKMPEGCEIKDMKMTGSGGSWRMECTKSPKMTADVVMTTTDSGFTMKQDMAMDQGGKMMKMKNTMTGKYLGPCTDAGKKK
ncbi:DUF3617 domain-containing protein [Usitatibacter palustris]|nr:DUF3617 family protein [Usitatibacter palustris]